MSAGIKSLVVAVLGLLFAVVLGSQLGKGNWLLPVGLAGGCVLFALYIFLFRAVRLEALLLGGLIFGYIVGNRGFAQISFGANTPLYLGELGMVACLAILGLRIALKRDQPMAKTPLTWAILSFLILGGVRLYFDVILHANAAPAMVAIRDSATVYYALFFFIAYKLGSNVISRRAIERCLFWGCIILLPVFVIFFFVSPLPFNRLTLRGFPVIAHKGDLTTTYLAFASFYFFLRPGRGALRVLFRILSLLFFAGMLSLMSRAAMFGFVCAAFLLLIARRPHFILYQAAMGCALLLVVAVLQLAQIGQNTGFLSRLTDKVTSVADVSHSGRYRGTIGESSADNNEFRLVFWKTVFNETMDKGPWFGLGFGYNLTAGFLRAYYVGDAGDPTVRSPHSIWMTVLGRMGVIGLLCFSALVFYIVRDAFHAARLVARGKADPSILSHWCAVLVLLGAASFGVVLEGPMGGIVFWSLLGLAASQTQSKPDAIPEAISTAVPAPRRLRGELVH